MALPSRWARRTGLLLIAGGGLFFVGLVALVAGTPFTVPGSPPGDPLEPLLTPIAAAIGLNLYQLATLVLAAALVVVSVGLAILAGLLRRNGSRLLAPLSLGAWLLGVVAWGPGTEQAAVLGDSLLFRLVRGLATWGDALGDPTGPLALGSGLLLGGAIIDTKLPSALVGWLVVIWSGAWLALVVVTGLYGSAPVYVTALVVGVALLRAAS